MGSYKHINDNEFSNKNRSSSNNDHSTEKAIIIASGVAIAGIVMAAAAVMFSGDNWVIGILALLLCIFIIWLCKFILEERFNAIKWKNYINHFFRLCILLFTVLLAMYIWQNISVTTDKAVTTERFSETDIPIVIDLAYHSTHGSVLESILDGAVSAVSAIEIPISKESFMNCLREVSKGEIRGEYYQSYRGDGEQQMLAIVEGMEDYEKADAENLYGTIWYVDKYGARVFDSKAKEYIWPYQPFFDDSNGNIYLSYGLYQPDGNIIYVLGIDDTGPYQPVISGKGSDLHINEYEEIELTALKNASGTDDAIYYFYVEGAFIEYGGIEITLGELLDIQDATLKNTIGKLLSKECQINTIYYRQNGIINVNFSKEHEGGELEYYHITFRYDGEHARMIPVKTGEEYGKGSYLEALIPSIAVYPEEFPY